MSLNSEALTAIVGEHSRDHSEGGVSRLGCTGCAMVEYLEHLEREREAMKIELEAWLGLKPHVEAWLKEREADRAAIRAGKGLDDVLGMLIGAAGGCPNADDDCCPSTEECKVGEALAMWKDHAAAIARATGQEGAR